MRTENDAIRSVKRYLAQALGQQWEVRLWTDEGSFSPPIARVAKTTAATYTSRRVFTDVVMGMQIHCYLVPAKSTSAALLAAGDAQQLLVTAIETGLGLAWPRRIPLYDYDGVPEDQGSDARSTFDFLRVLDFSVNSVQDNDDPNVVIVVADLRVAWSQQTTIDPVVRTVESLRVEERAS
jgi:hypothetical protein